MTKRAVVLLSGGLDSATCLAIANDSGYTCTTLGFDYGQRHRAELNAAQNLSEQFGADHRTISINMGDIGGSALTDHTIAVPDYTGSAEIPVTYVPARNTVFLSLALGVAETIEANTIFIGVSAIDYSGYPDCRPEYIAAFETMANLATKRGVEGHPITITTPLIKLSKAETILQGTQLGVDYSQTVSCYRATDEGLACGSCDSCILRRRGFEEANLTDPTRYVA